MKTKRVLGLFLGVILLASAAFISEAKAYNFKAGGNRIEFTSGGEKIVGTLFLPANYKKGDRLPAVVVGGSWLTVKEQMAGLYARKLAEQGFAALAFDHRYFGESGGNPRQYESPRAKIEDFKNAISFLQTVPAIDPNGIGALGICASAGYLAYAVAEDARFKSFATVKAWLHDPQIAAQLYTGGRSLDRFLKEGEAARRKFEQTGEVDYVPADSTTDNRAAMFGAEYYEKADRGMVPEWKNQFAVMSWAEWLTFDAIKPAAQIRVPTLIVHTDRSQPVDGARKFYASLAGPKDLFWTEGLGMDFYDREPLVNKAVQAVANHFRNTLNTENKKR